MSPRKYVLTVGKPPERWQPDYRSSPLPSLYRELPFDSVTPEEFEIEFCSFCLSGDFASGKKTVLETIETAAGILHENVGVTLDYLIVGENPSRGWKFGNYGNKINRAIEIRHHAKKPLIIREADFLALTSPATSPADLLDRLLTQRLRSTALLDPFTSGFTNGWACCLPSPERAPG